MTGADPRIAAGKEIIERFCGDDEGRSVALSFCAHKRDRFQHARIEVNGEVRRPVASVIKVALVMALYDQALAGVLSLDEPVAVGSLGETRYCSILKAFDRDRTLSLRELAAIALITSDNPAAVHLEERVGYDAVNAVLVRAGAAPDVAMHVGFREAELGPANRVNAMSANDVRQLFELLRSERRYGPIVLALENNLRNNRIPALLPDDAVIAHKTGSLDGVVNDAGVVRLGLLAFTVVFLCDGQADPMATSADIAACSKELFDLLL